ncbi:ABC transporter ATP-binding protein [uncultured Arthrobacter sp.]|uniref:ABC transporter ATP-binding protein n=1 Tax=uncultured Arthrobacter sp. TaxID=114050 RepID=UPI00260A00C0|nr:ABC transporter ATP-binding protein [uncultured Arthrobacter sp.]
MTALLTPGSTHPHHDHRAFGIRFSRLGQSFGTAEKRRAVLRDVSLEVRPGEILAILGTSGCGKSTLLRTAAGLDAPDTGEVLIDGHPVRGIDERCAVAFQEPRLLPWHTLRANVAMGLPRSSSASAGKARVLELLELVGLTAFAKHRPREVSGGMAQRTSLARALARNPGVLLLDEPFGALDALTRIRMQDLLLDIHGVRPTTVLLVTHDVDEALLLADRILVLGPGAGQTGSTIAELLAVPGTRPRDRASADLAALRSTLLSMLGVDGH